MTNAGGGWTIVFAQASDSSASCSMPRLTTDTTVAGNALNYKWYNIPRAKKTAVSTHSSESILVRGSGNWIKYNRKTFDTFNSHQEHTVTVTAANGNTQSSEVGWSITGIGGGGDFGLTSSGTLDHHSSSSYYNLNNSCLRQLLYQYGQTGYDVNTGVGSWGATSSCTSECGTRFGFYFAMR